MKYLTLLFFILISSLTTAQKKDIIDFEILGNDTIFLSDLPQVEILAFNNNEDKKTYYILKKKVLKVYPYALIAPSASSIPANAIMFGTDWSESTVI